MSDAIRFEQVSHRYNTGGEVLTDISFSLARGEMAFLTGPSGAGKSTILQLVAASIQPVSGRIRVHGQPIVKPHSRRVDKHRQQIGMIFQDARLIPHRTTFENVALPLLIRSQAADEIGARVRAALDAVGLRGKAQAYPATLSSGEQQRVGIARAVVARPRLLLADEPTGNLDLARAREIMRLFCRFNEVGTSVLIVTHAVTLADEFPCRVMHLAGGHLDDGQTRQAHATEN